MVGGCFRGFCFTLPPREFCSAGNISVPSVWQLLRINIGWERLCYYNSRTGVPAVHKNEEYCCRNVRTYYFALCCHRYWLLLRTYRPFRIHCLCRCRVVNNDNEHQNVLTSVFISRVKDYCLLGCGVVYSEHGSSRFPRNICINLRGYLYHRVARHDCIALLCIR
jgi:hypothetical protein